MAKIKKQGFWGMLKDNTDIPKDITITCNPTSQVSGYGHGCGAVFITEGKDKYERLVTQFSDNQRVGWIVKCPQCGNELRVDHPEIKQDPKFGRRDVSSCFVATCCFGDLDAPEVILLRRWRDEKLTNSATGRRFVAWYYSGFGNRAAMFISNKPALRRIGRAALGLFIRLAVK